jgi:DNA-binding transcriptional MerR regulator
MVERTSSRARKVGATPVEESLLRIGDLASRAGVSRRTVDFYTGSGLLTPVRRSGGNFRLYRATDVVRISAIRRLEAQGVRLDEISQILTADGHDHPGACPSGAEGGCPADPRTLQAHLASVDAQLQALRDAAEMVDPQTRGAMAGLVARAQVLIATAGLLAEELVAGSQLLPPL